MGFFEHDDSYEREQYERFQNMPPQAQHEGKFSHELIAGAASFAVMRAYEQHQAQNGKPPSFQLAKEIMAGIAGAEVDKLIETKGLDEVDALRAKHQAREQATQALANSREFGNVDYQQQQYGGGGYGGGYEQRGFEGGPGGYGGPQGGYGGPQGGYGGNQGYGGGPQGGYGGPQGGYGGPQGGYGGQQGGYGGPGGPGGYDQGGYGGPPQGEFEGERRHHHHGHHEERREW